MKHLSKCIAAQNMAASHSVRISTYLFSLDKEISKSLEIPLLRVGRLVIYRCGPERLKNASEARRMLHRTLIAVLIFQNFLGPISNRNTLIQRVSVLVLPFLISLRYFLTSNEDLCHLVCKGIKMDFPQSLMYLFPHTLFIDSSLNLKGIVAFILLRYVRLCEEFQTTIMISQNQS